MYVPNPSPFEQYRLKHLNGIAMSADLFKMIAEAFEAGQIAEREACARVVEDVEQSPNPIINITNQLAAAAIRARGQG